MARVLLSESDPAVRSLLEALLVRSGHDPFVANGQPDSELPAVDLVLAEPAYGNGLRHARALRQRDGSLPIVLVSILPPKSPFLELSPAAYLMKPFAIAALERAVEDALRG
jgi:DNA-binding response OmpR family regulator